jgi:glycosyltransferase involved in cell wall biosynthesis
MAKRILMIAYHFPPLQGSSGIQRTLKFSKYLPEFGWQPIILTAHPRAYRNTGNDQINEISDQVIVHRAFALDTSKHLSFMKRYPRILSLPDRWVSWLIGAIPVGLYLIKKYKPDVIWSTYPIATAHLIGFGLNRITNIPWIADFRDPMVDAGFPSEPLLRHSYQWIEEKTITHCKRAVYTTPGAVEDYKLRFPTIPHSRFSLIENGYDEDVYKKAEENFTKKNLPNKQFVLVHSGVVYSSERNPIQFFKALSALLKQKLIEVGTFKVILRATYNDENIQKLINQYGIDSIVFIAPPISYQEALSEMLAADGLLIIQASNCNSQIPAKLYEYVRARRPIFALTDIKGDTATKLLSLGINTIAQLDSEDDISQKLLQFIESAKNNSARIVPMEEIITNSRKYRTEELVNLLETVTKPKVE